jgi:hypothetical protein
MHHLGWWNFVVCITASVWRMPTLKYYKQWLSECHPFWTPSADLLASAIQTLWTIEARRRFWSCHSDARRYSTEYAVSIEVHQTTWISSAFKGLARSEPREMQAFNMDLGWQRLTHSRCMDLLQSLKHRSCIYQLIAEHEPPVPSIRGADQPSTRNKLFHSVAVDQRNDCPCWEDKTHVLWCIP